MPSMFPSPRPPADSAATRCVFERWLRVQEEHFPLEHPQDRSWQAELRRHALELVSPDVVVHGVPMKGTGRAAWLEFLIDVGSAYPDGQTTYHSIIVENDLACAHWTWRATYRPQDGREPQAGRPVTVNGVMIERIGGGQVVEHWAIIDQLAWLRQLGAIDPSVALHRAAPSVNAS
jgi:predicted ester cyclase